MRSKTHYVRCNRTGLFLSMRGDRVRWVARQYAQLFTPQDALFLASRDDLWWRHVPTVTTTTDGPARPTPTGPRLVKRNAEVKHVD